MLAVTCPVVEEVAMLKHFDVVQILVVVGGSQATKYLGFKFMLLFVVFGKRQACCGDMQTCCWLPSMCAILYNCNNN